MEIHYQTSDSLALFTYVNGALADVDQVLSVYQIFITVVRLSDNEVIVDDQTAIRTDTGKYKYVLTTENTSKLGNFKATWTYTISGTENTKTEFYEVVVPYTSAQEVREMFPAQASKSNEEIYRKEKIARRLINIYCNQSFDFEEDVQKVVFGKWANLLELPRKMYNLQEVILDETDITSDLEIYEEFWLKPTWVTSATMKFTDIKRGITEPSFYFHEGFKYYVTGDWGWQFVPENISLAAMILVNDYFCDDTLLREHGVIDTQLGDRSMEFKRDLWGTTGNYNVDQLLADYTFFNARLI